MTHSPSLLRALWLPAIGLVLLTGCAKTQAPAAPASQSTSTSSQSSKTATSNSDGGATNAKLSVADAIAVFHKQFGTAAKLTDLTLKPVGGQLQYRLEGLTAADEVKLTLDATAGTVLGHGQEPRDDDDADQPIAPANLAPLTRITAAATGAIAGTATAWSLDMDNGQPVWEVTVHTTAGRTGEVHVQATTAKVLSHELNDDDDDDD